MPITKRKMLFLLLILLIVRLILSDAGQAQERANKVLPMRVLYTDDFTNGSIQEWRVYGGKVTFGNMNGKPVLLAD